MKLKHYLFNFLEWLEKWRKEHDICEVCHENPVELRCYEGCGKRICSNCESYYYEDATICVECRNAITPEQEVEERQEAIVSLAEECTCPDSVWIGHGNHDIACELTEDEHDAIWEYKRAQVTK